MEPKFDSRRRLARADGGDDGNAGAPRARRQRLVVRSRGWNWFWPSAAGHHRPFSDRRAADGERLRTLRHHHNGEIYNAPLLRRELEARGSRFRGTSDTEVLLGAIVAWGLEAALQRVVGMFAFALWDREARILSLVRDRIGKKPLFWYRRGNLLLFGSELKALI